MPQVSCKYNRRREERGGLVWASSSREREYLQSSHDILATATNFHNRVREGRQQASTRTPLQSYISKHNGRLKHTVHSSTWSRWQPKSKECRRDTYVSQSIDAIEESRHRDKQRGRGRHYRPALFVDMQPTCWLVINPLGFTEWTAILRRTLSTKNCTTAADS